MCTPQAVDFNILLGVGSSFLSSKISRLYLLVPYLLLLVLYLTGINQEGAISLNGKEARACQLLLNTKKLAITITTTTT